MINRKIKLLHEYFLTCLKICATEVATWSGYKTYAEKLHIMDSWLIEAACSVFDFNPENETFTFLHGMVIINVKSFIH